MKNLLPRRRAFLLLAGLPLSILAMTGGSDCEFEGGFPIFFPPVIVEEPPPVVVVDDFITIELVNDTPLPVDPGVFVDGFQVDLGTVAPLDFPPPFDVDCIPGDTLTIDPILFLSTVDGVFAANAPIELLEGLDYFCGDIITLFFSQDGTGAFFVDVAVNDIILTF